MDGALVPNDGSVAITFCFHCDLIPQKICRHFRWRLLGLGEGEGDMGWALRLRLTTFLVSTRLNTRLTASMELSRSSVSGCVFSFPPVTQSGRIKHLLIEIMWRSSKQYAYSPCESYSWFRICNILATNTLPAQLPNVMNRFHTCSGHSMMICPRTDLTSW